MSTPILEVQALSKRFGGVRAVNDMTFAADRGKITAIVGPNGAGKTTLFNLVSSVTKPTAGRVRYDGADVTGRAPEQLARRGLSRTFQHVSVFGSLSLLENVLVGMDQFSRRTRLGRRVHRDVTPAARRDRAVELLRFVGLRESPDRPAASLPYGQKKLLDLANTLAAEPELLMLDEPAAGLNSAEKSALADVVRRVNQAGVSVCVVEHDMPFIRSIAEYMVVVNFGALLAEGRPAEVLELPAVVEAYLGPGNDKS